MQFLPSTCKAYGYDADGDGDGGGGQAPDHAIFADNHGWRCLRAVIVIANEYARSLADPHLVVEHAEYRAALVVVNPAGDHVDP